MDIAPGVKSSRWKELNLDLPDSPDWGEAIDIFKAGLALMQADHALMFFSLFSHSLPFIVTLAEPVEFLITPVPQQTNVLPHSGSRHSCRPPWRRSVYRLE